MQRGSSLIQSNDKLLYQNFNLQKSKTPIQGAVSKLRLKKMSAVE